jgi:uncharacterized membrane protein YciS (DUF1049 family)
VGLYQETRVKNNRIDTELAPSRLHLYLPGDLDPAAKLTFALKWQILNAVALAIGIFAVALGRNKPESFNPIIAQDDYRMKVNQRYLQNTLEQFSLATVVQLCLATWLESRDLKIIPLICILFLIGRICFLVGYRIRPEFRIFGFGFSWFPNIFSLLYCLYRLCSKM